MAFTGIVFFFFSPAGGRTEAGPGRGLHGGAQRAAHLGDQRRHRGAVEQAASGEEDDPGRQRGGGQVRKL